MGNKLLRPVISTCSNMCMYLTLLLLTFTVFAVEGSASNEWTDVRAHPDVHARNTPAIDDAAQAIRVTGKVSASSDGTSLPGVSVLVKNTNMGTVTDVNGNYSIDVSGDNDILVFSYVGYVSQEVALVGSRTIDIVLIEDVHNLEEIVVVAYGEVKKTSLTAAVSTMDGENIALTPIPNVTNGLGGRMSGVIVKQGRGEPGKDQADIFVRGISTIGNSQPLIVVDGIPRGGINELNANAIETITVLKDAAAVAPYGVAGANGVVLITTKRGKTGKPTLSYNAYVGFQNPVVLPDYVNSYEYAQLRNFAAANEGLPAPYSESDLQKYQDGSDPDAYPTNDDIWGTLTTRNALLVNHNIDLSGGTENVKYYAALGYISQEGMWKATSMERYNLNLNLDAKVTNTTSLSFNFFLNKQQNEYPQATTGRIFELIGYLHPLYGPFRYSNGMPGSFVTGTLFGDGYNRGNYTTLYSKLSLEQEISVVPGLKLMGTFAYDPSFFMTKHWTMPVHVATLDKSQTPYVIKDAIWGQTKPSLNQSYSNPVQTTYQVGFNYDKSFGRHKLNVLGLLEGKNNDYMSLGASRMNFNLYIDEIGMGSASQADRNNSGSSSGARQMGAVYRVSYDYDSKYLIEASGRYDGHYYFAPEERFGFFPSASVGWRLSEEGFLKDRFAELNNLKLRASYGEVGALAGGPNQYMSTYNVLGTAYAFGGNAVQGVAERAESNPHITWERARKTDIGLEVGLWNGLLDFELDYFFERRSNMLLSPQVQVPAEYGIGLSQVNAGKMENKGFDFSAISRHDISKDFQISLGGTFTYAKNKLVQVFEGPTTYNNPNRRITGRSLGTQFGFEALGYFQESDFDEAGNLKSGIAVQPWGAVQPGDLRYADLNGDGKIDDNDITVIGDPNAAPQIIYGISPSVRYKAFSLDVLFQGAGKTDWYQSGATVMPFWGTMLPYRHNFDFWTPENPNAANPRITSSPTVNNEQRSSHWMANASYLRLKSITLSYSVPQSVVNLINIQSARFYVSGQNVITWTGLRNFDPEIGPSEHWFAAAPWIYPSQKAISIGANITF